MNIVSWNVNGIRAILKKGFEDWLKEYRPDILCIQETKVSEDKLDDFSLENSGYHRYYACAEKKGYSGVAIFTKLKPEGIIRTFSDGSFDSEGRLIGCDYGSYILLNIYFPNGNMSEARLDYKLRFYESFLFYIDSLKKSGKNIIFCGDVNTAHKPVDLARPKENENTSGFLPVERDWITRVIEHGFADVFRHFDKGPGRYTWWDYKTRARERNVGWRLDYFFCNEEFLPGIKKSLILDDVHGSDHCPVMIELEHE